MSQKNPEDLHDLLVVKVKALYDIENELTKALPKMAEASNNPQLKQAFQDHLKETEGHVKRLEQIFEKLEVAPEPEKSEGIRGLISDAEWCIDNVIEPAALDAALIASAQYAEHLEMAGYGSAREWAKTMGHNEIADMLEQTEQEEKAADEKLSMLATSEINEAANTMSVSRGAEGMASGRLQTNE